MLIRMVYFWLYGNFCELVFFWRENFTNRALYQFVLFIGRVMKMRSNELFVYIMTLVSSHHSIRIHLKDDVESSLWVMESMNSSNIGLI